MKRLSLFLTILCAIAPAMAQQSLSGHLFSGNSGAVSSAFARLRLDNQGANVAKVSGTGILVQTQFDVPANSTTGVFSSNFYDNDHISPAGTQWIVEYWFNGQMISQAPYTFTGGGPYNLDSMAPNTTLPVIAAPTGDTTYGRLDNGNTSSWDLGLRSILASGAITSHQQLVVAPGTPTTGTQFYCQPDQLGGSWSPITVAHDAVCTFDINGSLGTGGLTIANHNASNVGIRITTLGIGLFGNGNEILDIGLNATGLSINKGIWQSGTGLKHLRASSCTTGAAQFNFCTTTVALPGASFADANYTVTCTMDNVTTGFSTIGNIGNKTASQFQVNVINLISGSSSGIIDCIAIHD